MITATSTASSTAAAAASAQAAQPGGALGKDAFMKLLIAQMKNQDPMNPMQGDQMAAQLAQFSSLEQMQQMNQTLSSQAAGTSSVIASSSKTVRGCRGLGEMESSGSSVK